VRYVATPEIDLKLIAAALVLFALGLASFPAHTPASFTEFVVGALSLGCFGFGLTLLNTGIKIR
jgi:hypothetical protein